MKGFDNTVSALVLGGSSGFGLACAKKLASSGRLTTPEDVADVVYLLCTDEARWINGALIRADGGEHISG
jgi:enoyl-[acyl-carrier protein] reductase III